MAERIPILKLRRTQPVQGKSVTVYWEGDSGKDYGMTLFPFEVWIKLQKLLQRGQESNAREQYPVQLKVVVEGYVPGKAKVKPLEAPATLPSLYREPLKEPDSVTPEQQAEAQEEEDAEAELQKVLAEEPTPTLQEKLDELHYSTREEKLIRTLKGGD